MYNRYPQMIGSGPRGDSNNGLYQFGSRNYIYLQDTSYKQVVLRLEKATGVFDTRTGYIEFSLNAAIGLSILIEEPIDIPEDKFDSPYWRNTRWIELKRYTVEEFQRLYDSLIAMSDDELLQFFEENGNTTFTEYERAQFLK